MTVKYDPGSGIIYTALRIRYTVLVDVLSSFTFYWLLVFHVGVKAAVVLGYFDAEEYKIQLPMGLTVITGNLMTFFVCFYNGHVFSRFNQLYGLVKNMNEYCLYAVTQLQREVGDKGTLRKVTRMLLASCFIFFFERTASDDQLEGHNISEEEWGQLRALELLSDKEEQMLREHIDCYGKAAIPSFLLMEWAIKSYRRQYKMEREFEKTLWNIRRCQDDVVEMMEMPMPFQYFHIMNLMLTLNLTLWGYSLALEDNYLASFIFLFVQMIFQGMRALSVALADPFGDDDADFPLNEWMTELYMRCHAIVENNFTGAEEFPRTMLEPMAKLEPGHDVINLMVDLTQNRTKKTRPSTVANTRAAPDGNGFYTAIPANAPSIAPSTDVTKRDLGGSDTE